MHFTKNRWFILAVNCLIDLCIGTLYAWSVFSPALAQHLTASAGIQLSPSDLTIVFSVANGVGPITLICGGVINDRLGPKLVIFSGGLLFGGGIIASGFCRSLPALILCYGVLAGLGLGLVYGCTVSGCVKLFPDHRGLAGGLTTAFYGSGSVLVPPIATRLIHSLGILPTLRILGAVSGAVICLGAWFCEKPASLPVRPNAPAPKQGPHPPPYETDWRGMLRRREFYTLFLLLCCGAISGMMCISQASSVAQVQIGMTAQQAAMAVSMLALFNTSGRVCGGMLSDHIGRLLSLTAASSLSVLGLLTLHFSGRSIPFCTGLALVGLGFGTFMSVFPGLVTDAFGTRHSSVNYGIIFIGFALAGLLGPGCMTFAYQRTGNYQSAFLLAAGIALLGFLFEFVYHCQTHKRHD